MVSFVGVLRVISLLIPTKSTIYFQVFITRNRKCTRFEIQNIKNLQFDAGREISVEFEVVEDVGQLVVDVVLDLFDVVGETLLDLLEFLEFLADRVEAADLVLGWLDLQKDHPMKIPRKKKTAMNVMISFIEKNSIFCFISNSILLTCRIFFNF